MVTPTWCHGAIWGIQFRENVDRPDYWIDTFNLVIRLSKAKQSALPCHLSAFFTTSCGSSGSAEPWFSFSATVKPFRTARNCFLFINAAFGVEHEQNTCATVGIRHVLFLQVWSLWYLVRLNMLCTQFVGTWTAVYAHMAWLDNLPGWE